MITNDDFITISKAINDKRIPYSVFWVRILCQKGRLKSKKIGEGKGSVWLVSFVSLLDYVSEMEKLGKLKHSPK